MGVIEATSRHDRWWDPPRGRSKGEPGSVGFFMPPFDRYVRVRPPFMGLGPGGLVPVTWSRLFAAAGKPFDENTGVSELPAIRDWVPDILRAGHRPSRRDLAAQAEWFEVAARLEVDAPTGLVGGGDCTLGAATFAALVERADAR